MKVGDLVVMSGTVDYSTLRQDLGTGLIVDDKIVRNRISVLWADSNGKIDYEPVKWLEVVNEVE